MRLQQLKHAYLSKQQTWKDKLYKMFNNLKPWLHLDMNVLNKKLAKMNVHTHAQHFSR